MGKCKFQEGDRVKFYSYSKGQLVGFIKGYMPVNHKYDVRAIKHEYSYRTGEYHWIVGKFFKDVSALYPYTENMLEFYGVNKVPNIVKYIRNYTLQPGAYSTQVLLKELRGMSLQGDKITALEKYLSSKHENMDVYYDSVKNIELVQTNAFVEFNA